MTPAYIRWRCERIEQLLRFHSRKSALEIIAGEALEKPWESDPRPAPKPLPLGGPHGLNPPHLQPPKARRVRVFCFLESYAFWFRMQRHRGRQRGIHASRMASSMAGRS